MPFQNHLPVIASVRTDGVGTTLTIDGSFVRNIANDPIDRALVETVNHIGHMMGIRTIAEFVENEAVLKRLDEIGVDYAQGYVFGRAMALMGGALWAATRECVAA